MRVVRKIHLKFEIQTVIARNLKYYENINNLGSHNMCTGVVVPAVICGPSGDVSRCASD